jgi:hypothetical protein
MSTDVDAVIAALKVVLQTVSAASSTSQWQVKLVNRWINQLPGARWGRWRQLKLKGPGYDRKQVYRGDMLVHVQATLAYLETNREAIAAQRSWWPFGRRALRSGQEPAQQEQPKRVEERKEAPTVQDGTTKPKWLN